MYFRRPLSSERVVWLWSRVLFVVTLSVVSQVADRQIDAGAFSDCVRLCLQGSFFANYVLFQAPNKVVGSASAVFPCVKTCRAHTARDDYSHSATPSAKPLSHRCDLPLAQDLLI